MRDTMRILVVDDEPQITRVLRASLASSGYDVLLARDGVEAFDLFRESTPDLVITDLFMPRMDGIELTRSIRQMSEVPIIVLSVREQETMKIAALDEGADDYVTKPFSTQELLARVRAQLRRSTRQPQEAAQISIGDFEIDTEQYSVRVRQQEVHLTPKEFALLLVFARHPNRVLTHRTLLKAVWGAAGEDQPEYLRVLVAQLRKKIETTAEPRYILNEPWVGYRFDPDQSSPLADDITDS